MKEEEVVISVLTIQGLVQGVGFRSFIYRIASEMNICGEVDNRNNGVCIRATLTPVQRELFIERIRREHPKVASIHRITVSERIEVRNPYMGFRITPSRSESLVKWRTNIPERLPINRALWPGLSVPPIKLAQ